MNYRAFTFLIVAFLIVSFESLLAQTVKVVDETTLQPVVNVYIYNNGRNKMVSTNGKGEADIAKFSNVDTLNFQHPGYKSLSLTYQEVEERGSEVKLVEKSVLMDEIYVSASKREQDATEIPQRISQIGEKHILFNNPQTSADLLQSTGKVFVQKSQMGGGSPMIRGFAANSVLLAVDGVRMNNAIFRSGNLQNVISIDANALKNTEVLFGPGSIIYGSDALGGVMNFQTKEPTLSFDENESVVKVNTMARYSSANNERTAHADASFGYQKWGMLTSITYSDFDDMRAGSDFYEEFSDFGKREEYVDRESGRDTVLTNDDVTLRRP
jgi:hemoglobin/transferrin/lactoferrin receptor protein